MSRLQPDLPTSGTAERSALQRVLLGNAATISPGGLGGLGYIDPVSAGLGLAATTAVPYLAARAYTAPGTLPWLTRAANPSVQAGLGMGGILGAHTLAQPE